MSESLRLYGQTCQTSLSFTISRSLLKLMSIESVMPSKHLIPCRPLLGVSCSIGVGQRDLNKKETGILSSSEVTGWRKGLEGSRERIRTGVRQGPQEGSMGGEDDQEFGANWAFWKSRSALEGRTFWDLMGVIGKV